MQRRLFASSILSSVACGLATGAGLLAWADTAHALDSEWWPYGGDAAVRIDPVITLPSSGKGTGKGSGTSSGKGSVNGPGKHLSQPLLNTLAPPKAYDYTGRKFDIDPWLIFGVALQESRMKFGERTLPYPWTLCVAGSPRRYGSYQATLNALRRYVTDKGIRNVDCGAMQVNWRWHNDKLQSFERALSPYPNLAVGAQILREHFDRQGSWRRAAALYHTGSDTNAATAARGKRYADGVFSTLARLGLDVRALEASRGWRSHAV